MSRDLTKLSLCMQGKARLFLAECHRQGLDIVIICTDRTNAEQQACYKAGLSMCRPGTSAHNAVDYLGFPAAEAFDVGVIRNGKYIGDGNDPDYQKAGHIGESVGLSWAGRWGGRIREVAHFQNPNWRKP